MRTPQTLAEQRFVRCRGELLRGCGVWPSWTYAANLEPPFEPFDWSTITGWDLSVSGYSAPYQGQFIDQLKRLFQPVPCPPVPFDEEALGRQSPLCVTTFAQYVEDEVTYPKAEQLVLALGSAREPIAFELFGTGGSREREGHVEIRFVSGAGDVPLVESQLHSHYPRSAVVSREYGEAEENEEIERLFHADDALVIAPLYLINPYCFPLRVQSGFAADPLGTALAVLDELPRNEWALLQILFSRARREWAANLRDVCQEPYDQGSFTVPGLDRGMLNDKLKLPLYSVAVTLAANRKATFDRLAAFIHQFDGPHNQLAVRDETAWARQWSDNPFPDMADWAWAVAKRQSIAPGMLLNAAELTGMMHLPSTELPGDRLLRVKTQTRQPPKVAGGDTPAVILGQNVHRGKARRVTVSDELRRRHCYVAGASGTGKSTLLLQMILQDVRAGRGVGLLDPHGDLVKAVLSRVPKERLDDVILFDAADTEYPFALNILDARDEAERERIVAETIMALERYFPASWGPRLERILQYTIRTVLHAVRGATLADVEQMLTDAEYRAGVLERTKDERMLQFWNTQFPFMPKNATDPVLNKLSVFLLDRQVRNIICQRRAAVDFDHLLNQGKILLANLSTGLLTEKVAGTLGSFLVTKIVNAAFRRAGMPESRRRPWYLYVDEFQSFMNLSIGFERILAESRKYGLVLAGLANQYVGQISGPVRQAIFGNVGTLITFRLGVEDAHAVAKELGVFTAEDILNLEMGQAIVRTGGSSTAFNLQTFPAPPLGKDESTQRIVALSRQRFARPRREVERELVHTAKAAERLQAIVNRAEEPTDPNEDDLVV